MYFEYEYFGYATLDPADAIEKNCNITDFCPAPIGLTCRKYFFHYLVIKFLVFNFCSQCEKEPITLKHSHFVLCICKKF